MNTSKIYWSPAVHNEDTDWTILYKDPTILFEDLKNKKSKNLEKSNNLFLCPSVKNLTSKIVIFKCPLQTYYHIENNNIIPVSKNYLAWDVPHSNNLENNKLFSIKLSYIFFSEEDIEMTMTSPFFSDAPHLQYGSIVPGSFNISKWFRNINLEFNIWNKNKFKIEKNEDIVYFHFNCKNPIELIRFDMTKKLDKISYTCGTHSYWEKFIPLYDRYKRFKESQLNKKVIKEIKKNIV